MINILPIKLRALSGIAGFRARVAGRHCRGFLTEANGVYLISPVKDFTIGRRLAFNGSYDSSELRKYENLIMEGDGRLLVVGTHVGAVLIPLACMAESVVGVEANPETFELLKMNLAINGVDNCQVLNVAAYDHTGELEFVASAVNSGGSKIMPKRRRFEFFYDRPERIKVPCARLDDVLEADFDVVIMDVEGAEFRAIGGMQQILSRAKYLICEVVPNHLENVDSCTFDQLISRIPHNFQWFSIVNGGDTFHRDDAGGIYEVLRSDHYFNGVNLLCSTGDTP